MKTIRMLSTEVGADGESLESGSVYLLNDASADRWLRRGTAEEVQPVAAVIEEAAPVVHNKPGPKPKAQ